MKMIEDWRDQLNHLWSIRLTIALMLLGSADQVLYYFNGSIPPVVYSIIGAAIVVARMVAQKVKDGGSDCQK